MQVAEVSLHRHISKNPQVMFKAFDVAASLLVIAGRDSSSPPGSLRGDKQETAAHTLDLY